MFDLIHARFILLSSGQMSSSRIILSFIFAESFTEIATNYKPLIYQLGNHDIRVIIYCTKESELFSYFPCITRHTFLTMINCMLVFLELC